MLFSYHLLLANQTLSQPRIQYFILLLSEIIPTVQLHNGLQNPDLHLPRKHYSQAFVYDPGVSVVVFRPVRPPSESTTASITILDNAILPCTPIYVQAEKLLAKVSQTLLQTAQFPEINRHQHPLSFQHIFNSCLTSLLNDFKVRFLNDEQDRHTKKSMKTALTSVLTCLQLSLHKPVPENEASPLSLQSFTVNQQKLSLALSQQDSKITIFLPGQHLNFAIVVDTKIPSWVERKICKLKHTSGNNIRNSTACSELLVSHEKNRKLQPWSFLFLLYQSLLREEVSLLQSTKLRKIF